MQHKSGTTTDRLNNILQVLQLGRKSGHLITERGEGAKVERGEIVFVHGQITFARCGNLYGERALQWLQGWGPCSFIFTSTPHENTTTPPDRGFHADAYRSSPSQPSLPSVHSPLREIRSRQRNTDQIAVTTGAQKAIAPVGSHPPDRLLSVEQGLQLIAQANLSRYHRRLYLLIDGQHSFEELMRLMGKSPEDIQRLLLDLKYIGAILY